MKQVSKDLKTVLGDKMSLKRLTKTGLFIKLEVPTEEIRTDLLLHRTVLDKALLDHFNKDENFRLQAKLWCDLNNPDFIEACDRALLSSELVYSTFHAVTEVFVENGEDTYSSLDNKRIARMSDEDKDFFLDYVEPDWDEK